MISLKVISIIFFIYPEEILVLVSKKLLGVTNHPVHIIGQEKELNYPTALIPFCEFSGNMSVMGVQIDQFDVPFCNSFRPRIIRDQLCYTVDPNEYKYKIDLKGELSLELFIHYNEDRQIEGTDSTEEHTVIVDTIGKKFNCLTSFVDN